MKVRAFLLMPILASLAACAGGPPPDPVTVHLAALNAKEKQRLYDGRHSNPPLLDVNRQLEERQASWDSDDLTWIETPSGWHARLRYISPDARGLRIGLCMDPADIPVVLTVEESGGAIRVPAERIGVPCDNGSMYFLPLVKGETITLRFNAGDRPKPPEFELDIRRVQHRGN